MRSPPTHAITATCCDHTCLRLQRSCCWPGISLPTDLLLLLLLLCRCFCSLALLLLLPLQLAVHWQLHQRCTSCRPYGLFRRKQRRDKRWRA
jgi:hypothetical protein